MAGLGATVGAAVVVIVAMGVGLGTAAVGLLATGLGDGGAETVPFAAPDCGGADARAVPESSMQHSVSRASGSGRRRMSSDGRVAGSSTNSTPGQGGDADQNLLVEVAERRDPPKRREVGCVG